MTWNADCTSGISRSPSTRRAWIEIDQSCDAKCAASQSPSTRRAWIEINYEEYINFLKVVALHPEGVDRNVNLRADVGVLLRRPPPGGRG